MLSMHLLKVCETFRVICLGVCRSPPGVTMCACRLPAAELQPGRFARSASSVPFLALPVCVDFFGRWACCKCTSRSNWGAT